MCADPQGQNVDLPAASPAMILAAQQSRNETAVLRGMIDIGCHPHTTAAIASNKTNR